MKPFVETKVPSEKELLLRLIKEKGKCTYALYVCHMCSGKVYDTCYGPMQGREESRYRAAVESYVEQFGAAELVTHIL